MIVYFESYQLSKRLGMPLRLLPFQLLRANRAFTGSLAGASREVVEMLILVGFLDFHLLPSWGYRCCDVFIWFLWIIHRRCFMKTRTCESIWNVNGIRLSISFSKNGRDNKNIFSCFVMLKQTVRAAKPATLHKFHSKRFVLLRNHKNFISISLIYKHSQNADQEAHINCTELSFNDVFHLKRF